MFVDVEWQSCKASKFPGKLIQSFSQTAMFRYDSVTQHIMFYIRTQFVLHTVVLVNLKLPLPCMIKKLDEGS